MNTNQKGKITELEILLAAHKSNIDVSIPYGDKSRYDQIWDVNGNLYRIQIKTARSKDSTFGKGFTITCKSTCNGVGHHYTKKEIDFFATTWEEKVYLIPVECCSIEKNLWLELYRSSNTSFGKMCLAKDYELSEVLKKL